MAGHCEYFATAMVILARAAGIPARYVTGYLQGERNRFSRRFVVRQSDAHAWAEVYFPGAGWVTFDATPAAGRGTGEETGWIDLASDAYAALARGWDDYIVGVDLGDQVAGFAALQDIVRGGWLDFSSLWRREGGGPGWPLAGTVVVLVSAGVVAAWILLKYSGGGIGRPREGGTVPAFYVRLDALLRRRGLKRGEGETPREFARRAAASLAPGAAAVVDDLTGLYYRVRYAAVAVPHGWQRQARLRLAELRRRIDD
jgi:transglutaminase-like putative cysteine protease